MLWLEGQINVPSCNVTTIFNFSDWCLDFQSQWPESTFESWWKLPVSEITEKILMLFEFYSDINLARECENKCGSEMFECLEDCGESTECSSSCYRGNIVCVDACPCHTGKNAKCLT